METEIVEKICAIRAEFDKLKEKYQSDIDLQDSVNASLDENEVPSVEKIRREYQTKTDKERLMRIGIVGAVKAGKSSLLNSLFFCGKEILPKAATPMTAALTELTYGDEISVKIDFFTEDDISELKRKHNDYVRKFDELKGKKIDELKEKWIKVQKRKNGANFSDEPDAETRRSWEEKSEKYAYTELEKNRNLAGAHEQYEMIKKSEQYRQTEQKEFTVSAADEIAGTLEEYVGADGKYQPFTSRVSITLPFEELRGISVVDTPGFNDPVPSRDARAMQALYECDVIFILSRATEFLSAEDMSVINKIGRTDKDREIFVVSTQVDRGISQLSISKQSKGDMKTAIQKVRDKNIITMKDNLKKSYISFAEKLLSNPDSYLLFTSGQCEGMAKSFSDRENWDSDRQKVWENLKEYYGDYFSDNDEENSIRYLKMLGNIETIRQHIDNIKSRKQEIFQKQLVAFESKYKERFENTKLFILKALAGRKKDIETKSIQQIEKDIENMQQQYDFLSRKFDAAFKKKLDEWAIKTKTEITDNLKDLTEEVRLKIDNLTKIKTTFIIFETKVVNASELVSTVNTYIREKCETVLPDKMEVHCFNLKKDAETAISYNIQSSESFDVDNICQKAREIVSGIFGKYDEKHYKYNGTDFFYKGKSEKSYNLKDEEADYGIAKARKKTEEVFKYFNDLFRESISSIKSACEKSDFGKKVLEYYLEVLKRKKQELEKPKQSLQHINEVCKVIEQIKWD